MRHTQKIKYPILIYPKSWNRLTWQKLSLFAAHVTNKYSKVTKRYWADDLTKPER